MAKSKKRVSPTRKSTVARLRKGAKKVAKNTVRPLNVAVARGTKAEQHFKSMVVIPAAIAPGLPHSPAHNLINHGGKTIQNLIYTNFFIGGAASWDANDIKLIDDALNQAMSDAPLNNVMMQYFNNKPITATFKPSHILPGAKPKVFSQGDVEKLVKSLFAQGGLAGFDFTSTVFNFMLPSGTILNSDEGPTAAVSPNALASPVPNEEDEASSTQGLGGYHGSVHVDKKTTVYYAVGVFSEQRPNGSHNGIVAFDKPWKNIVATFYHELCEARTDPDVEDAIRAGNSPNAVKFLGWTSQQGEECGDFPMDEAGGDLSLVMQEVQLANGAGKVPVQFQYSNAVQGPEGPIPAPH
jgi:hypothetical protein